MRLYGPEEKAFRDEWRHLDLELRNGNLRDDGGEPFSAAGRQSSRIRWVCHFHLSSGLPLDTAGRQRDILRAKDCPS